MIICLSWIVQPHAVIAPKFIAFISIFFCCIFICFVLDYNTSSFLLYNAHLLSIIILISRSSKHILLQISYVGVYKRACSWWVEFIIFWSNGEIIWNKRSNQLIFYRLIILVSRHQICKIFILLRCCEKNYTY